MVDSVHFEVGFGLNPKVIRFCGVLLVLQLDGEFSAQGLINSTDICVDHELKRKFQPFQLVDILSIYLLESGSASTHAQKTNGFVDFAKILLHQIGEHGRIISDKASVQK